LPEAEFKDRPRNSDSVAHKDLGQPKKPGHAWGAKEAKNEDCSDQQLGSENATHKEDMDGRKKNARQAQGEKLGE